MIQIVQVKSETEWALLKSLLIKLFEYENRLRADRKDFSQNVNGPFSYIKNNIAEHDGVAFLAMDGEQSIGFASGWVTNGDGLDQGDNRRGYLSDAFVLEEYRGQGIYKKLVEARKNHFKSLGISKLVVDTLGTNVEMQNILQKCDFKIHKIFYEMDI